MKKVFTNKVAFLLAANALMAETFFSCSGGGDGGGSVSGTGTGVAADNLPEPRGVSPVKDGLHGGALGA